MKTKSNKSKVIVGSLSIGLNVVLALVFVIIGLASFATILPDAAIPSGATITGLKDLLVYIWGVFINCVTFAQANVFSTWIIVVPVFLFGIAAIALWVTGIVKKRAHYIFTGLYQVLAAAIYAIFGIYFFKLFIDANLGIYVLALIFYICAAIFAVLSYVYCIIDIVKNPEVVGETNNQEAIAEDIASTPVVEEVKPVEEPAPVETPVEEVKPVEEPAPAETPVEEVKPVEEPAPEVVPVAVAAPVAAKKAAAKKKTTAKKTAKKKTATKAAATKKTATKKAEEKKPVVTETPAQEGTGKVYHVSFRKDLNKWMVRAEGSTKANKMFKTQREAIEFAKTLDNSVKVHSVEGKIRKA